MGKQSPAFKKINRNQNKFVKEYVKTGNLTQSALETYNHKTKQSAASHGSQLIKQPEIQNAILKAMEDNNLTPDWIVKQKKKLVNKGIEDLQEAKVSPEVLNKSLDGLFKIYEFMSGNSLVKTSNLHLHQHYESMTRDEVLKERNKMASWFDDIQDQ